jgi:hypothetical protein
MMTDMPTKTAVPSVRDAPLGFGTYFGTVMAIASGIAGIWAGIEGKNVETCAAAAVALVATFETLNGRFAQAVARIRQGAIKAEPWIDEAQERIATSHERASQLPPRA